MTLADTLAISMQALWLNRLRSFLTALGVIIGVGAVVAMVAIGEGAKARVEASFASMGSGMLIVQPGASLAGGSRGGFGTQPTLTWDDLEAIQTQLPGVRLAAATLSTSATLVGEEANWTTRVYGTSPDYLEIRGWAVTEGEPFTRADLDGGRQVALLGRTVVNQLYGPGVQAVGRTVRIRQVPFLVLGVLASKGQSPVGQDYDDAVYVPQTAFMRRIQGGLQKYVAGQLAVMAADPDQAGRLAEGLGELLRERHHLQPGTPDDFSIRNMAELAASSQQGTETLSLLLASIAAVSLLVGGIGIMNIMLVSVTERTHEIGLRMAIGAKGRDIRLQFLVEAMALSVSGGLVGIALGTLAAGQLAARFGWPVALRPDVMLLAVGFSALVGIGFGMYPADKAARLDPIEALRFE